MLPIIIRIMSVYSINLKCWYPAAEKWPILASWVEKPPVAPVVSAWHMASKGLIPSSHRSVPASNVNIAQMLQSILMVLNKPGLGRPEDIL